MRVLLSLIAASLRMSSYRHVVTHDVVSWITPFVVASSLNEICNCIIIRKVTNEGLCTTVGGKNLAPLIIECRRIACLLPP